MQLGSNLNHDDIYKIDDDDIYGSLEDHMVLL